MLSKTSVVLLVAALATTGSSCSDSSPRDARDTEPDGADATQDRGGDAEPGDAPLSDVEVDADIDVGGPLIVDGFERIVAGGIDDRLNGYPWAMELFDGDGDGTLELYVGTVHDPLCAQVAIAEILGAGIGEPPERWHCRNDLWGNWPAFFAAATPGKVYRGTTADEGQTWHWEAVFEPLRTETLGFRGARVFDGSLYMLGILTAGGVVWKTDDGETFEQASPDGMAEGGSVVSGGLRGAQVFDGRLHVANNGICEVYASSDPSTDAESWVQVNSTGFVDSGGEVDDDGEPLNTGIWQLGVFGDSLYVGTTNLTRGAELWRSDDPRPGSWTLVISGGWGNTVPQGYMTIRPFGDHVYLGTVIYPVGMASVEGFEVLRVDADDEVELLVGTRREPQGGDPVEPLSGWTGGFAYANNLYSWYMAEYDGWFYVGSYDYGSLVIDVAAREMGTPVEEWEEIHHIVLDELLATTDRPRQGGADLWRSQDGEEWEAVNLNGFGDYDNYGIRNMIDTPWGFMVGTANPVDGFELWLKRRD